MKPLLCAFILAAALAAHSGAHAQTSMLRITCEGNDAGAEVSINGVFKGECPLDVQVGAGTLKLRLVKKVDATRERVFEQEFRMGDGVVKKVEARLGPAQLTADGRRIVAERQRQEQEAARAREENRQREIALAEQRRQEQLARALAEFKAEGIEPGNGKAFRDCAECPEMVWIPPGQPAQRIPPANAMIGWLNQVNIAYPLAVGKFEVTFDEWDACVADGGCSNKPAEGITPGTFSDTRWGRGRQPVIQVSRPDVALYLAWLSRKSGQSYRLLSLAEFTYAARGGLATKLPWGDEIGSNNANCKNCGSKWDGQQTAPVGSFKPNAWGLHDMIGNVAEMVSDCQFALKSLEGAPKDGSPILTDCAVTVPPTSRAILGDRLLATGGAWNGDLGLGVTISSAYEKAPENSVGLRVARTYRPKMPGTGKGN